MSKQKVYDKNTGTYVERRIWDNDNHRMKRRKTTKKQRKDLQYYLEEQDGN